MTCWRFSRDTVKSSGDLHSFSSDIGTGWGRAILWVPWMSWGPHWSLHAETFWGHTGNAALLPSPSPSVGQAERRQFIIPLQWNLTLQSLLWYTIITELILGTRETCFYFTLRCRVLHLFVRRLKIMYLLLKAIYYITGFTLFHAKNAELQNTGPVLWPCRSCPPPRWVCWVRWSWCRVWRLPLPMWLDLGNTGRRRWKKKHSEKDTH